MAIHAPGADTSAYIANMVPGTPRAGRPRFAQTVLADMIDRIASGEFAPGTSLPSEPELLAEYGVSRGVAREAVKLLESRGIARTHHGLGTRVTPYDDWNLLDPIVLSACTRYDIDQQIQSELATLRASLESDLAESAARVATPADIDVLDGYLEDMQQAVERPDEFHDIDVLFHGKLMSMAGSRLIRQVVRTVHDHVRREVAMSFATAAELRATNAEHAAIRDAVAAGDPVAARAAMTAHITDAWVRRSSAIREHAREEGLS